ncbi:MAG: tetratricopeptide repeat protein [Deltaproteobacteria bacterium]|jgi:tetratricopeptide (TPR) repeat protein|nr:tetratricopeptide repeat protein [Deltaproteobacteria bacterium]
MTPRIWSINFETPGPREADPGADMRERGDLAGAEAAARDKLRMIRAALGNDNVLLLPFLDSLGLTLLSAYRSLEAMSVLAEALALSHKHIGTEGRDTFARVLNLGLAVFQLASPEEYLAYFRDAVAFRTKYAGENDWMSLTALSYVAVALAETGDAAEAVAILEDVVDRMESLESLETLTQPNKERIISARANLKIAVSLRDGGRGPGLDA